MMTIEHMRYDHGPLYSLFVRGKISMGRERGRGKVEGVEDQRGWVVRKVGRDERSILGGRRREASSWQAKIIPFLNVHHRSYTLQITRF